MRIPDFFKTIRFRLALGYSGLIILILFVLLVGINFAMKRSFSNILDNPPPAFQGDAEMWRRALESENFNNIGKLRTYSLIGAGAVILVGGVSGYFLSGLMLRPIDRLASMASRISHTNLKERLEYKGTKDEVKRLADAFDDMLERLETAFKSQKQFIQDASHELKTPIAIALTNIEVLELNHQATIKDYQHLAELMKSSLERMNGVNNGLLLLSEGKLTTTNFSKINFGNVIFEACDEVKSEAFAAQINLDYQPSLKELFISGDAAYIKQVAVNLIDNAIKYNNPGGSVKVTVYTEQSDVVLEVKDTGIGIAEADLPRIFERFYRVDKSRSRNRGGSGLGLAIVKKIVDDHGGSIRVESIPGKGSKFMVSFPGLSS